MSETVQEHVEQALDAVAVEDVPADEAEAIFEDALDRLEALRAVRGEQA